MKLHGLTLIELLLVIAIGTILLTLAVPNIYVWVQNNRVDAISTDLNFALRYAQQEAIRRGSPVSICPQSFNYTSCASDWTQGWMIFTNPNGGTTFDASTETLLQVHDPLMTHLELTSNPNTVFLTFGERGFLTTNGVTFLISGSACQGMNAQQLRLSSAGIISTARTNCP